MDSYRRFQESGLYYLQSRYYDPNIGRFINADGLITTGHDMLGNNLFAYCNDNPVNLIDPGGNKPGDLFDTMDEAAQNAAYYIGSLSFINGWEYGTNIYTVDVAVNVEVEVIEYVFGENTKITKSTVTVQRTVTKYTYSCEVTSRDPRSVTIPVPPAEINRVAIFHTHPYGSNQGITQLSGKDIAIAQHRGIPMYVYGPNGQMHVYYPQTNITVIWDLFPISTKQPWLQTPSWLL